MASVLINFNQGKTLDRVQQARLGETAPDSIGDIWSYVQFRQAVDIGQVVRDAQQTDLRVDATNDPAEVTAAAAIGTNTLEATGEFKDRDVRGAIGAIVAGAGDGQSFIVTDRIDDDSIRVQVLNTATGFVTDGKWATALTTDSRYRLSFPGAAYQADAASDKIRGISQVKVTSNDLNKFGWVRQTGLGVVKYDDAGSAIIPGQLLVPTTAGLVKDATVGGASPDAEYTIGRAEIADAGTTEKLIWAELHIMNRTQSHRLPHDVHPFAQPGQRIV